MTQLEIIQIDCGEVLGIAQVGEMYTSLLSAIAEGQSLNIDISKLERVDAAALQMLYSLAKALSQHNGILSWSAPSEAFSTAAELLGLEALLDIEQNNGDA